MHEAIIALICLLSLNFIALRVERSLNRVKTIAALAVVSPMRRIPDMSPPTMLLARRLRRHVMVAVLVRKGITVSALAMARITGRIIPFSEGRFPSTMEDTAMSDEEWEAIREQLSQQPGWYTCDAGASESSL